MFASKVHGKGCTGARATSPPRRDAAQRPREDGASRDGVLAYAHATGRDVPELLDAVARQLALGYQAVRVQTGVPGLGQVYGVGGAAAAGGYEPAGRGDRPPEERWDSATYLQFVPGVFERLRQELGPDLALLHDAHHRLTPIEAARLGKDVEPYRLFWLEDVTPADNPEALRWVRQHTTTPLAVGEVFTSIWDAERLFREQLIDYLRTAVVHAGGITPAGRMFELADLYQVRIAPFPHAYRFQAGFLHPGGAPGLGVEIDERLAARYPHEPAYLPVNGLLDGTVHEW